MCANYIATTPIFTTLAFKSSLMKKLLIALTFNLVFITSKLVAQTPYVAIPDSNFVHYLKTIVPTAFKGDSLDKNSTAVTTYTQVIYVSSLNIANLSGVQYFTSLQTLFCNNNSLTTLPTIPNSLQELYCNNNSLTTLPTLPNSLKTIECAANALTNLPTLPNSLKTIQCYANALTNLPTLPDSLISLDCSSNSLTSLPSLPDSLQVFYCNNNNITCFPTFPNSISAPFIDIAGNWYYNIIIDPNPYNCLPNHIAAMDSADLATPLCAAGNTNGCAVAGIEQYTINNEVKVYPNPASEMLHVECLMVNESTEITLTDIIGNTIYHSTFTTQHNTINVADLNEGVYNLSISTKEGLLNKRVVIAR